MNIDSLKYFYEVATLKSISKAANASHISQSALSQQLAKMEENLGIKALIRSNKGVELTEEGKILLNYSKDILKLYNNLMQDLDNVKLEKDILYIISSCLPGIYIIPQILPKLSSKFSDFSYDIGFDSYTNIQSNIINNICDISIGTTKINDLDLKTHYLGEDELIFVCRASSSLDIKDLPFLLLKDEINVENYVEKIIDPNKIILKTDSLHTITSCLLTTPSFSLLPKICIVDYLDSGLLKEIDEPRLEKKSYSLFLTHKNDVDNNFKDKIIFIIKYIKDLLHNKQEERI